METPDPKKIKNKYSTYVKYTGLASEMLVIMGGSTYLGYKIDQWIGLSFHLFTLILMILGFIGAILHVLKNSLK